MTHFLNRLKYLTAHSKSPCGYLLGKSNITVFEHSISLTPKVFPALIKEPHTTAQATLGVIHDLGLLFTLKIQSITKSCH